MGTEKKTCGKETNQREKKWFSWLRQFFSFCVKNTWIRWTGVYERERVFVYVYMFVCICLRMAGSIFIRFIITGVFRSLSARMELERIEQFKRAHNMLREKSSFFSVRFCCTHLYLPFIPLYVRVRSTKCVFTQLITKSSCYSHYTVTASAMLVPLIRPILLSYHIQMFHTPHFCTSQNMC